MKRERDETRCEQRQQTEQRPRAVAIILRQHEGLFYFFLHLASTWLDTNCRIQFNQPGIGQIVAKITPGCSLAAIFASSLLDVPPFHLHLEPTFDVPLILLYFMFLPFLPSAVSVHLRHLSFSMFVFFHLILHQPFPPLPPLSTPDSFLLFLRAHTLLTINPTCNALPFFSLSLSPLPVVAD